MFQYTNSKIDFAKGPDWHSKKNQCGREISRKKGKIRGRICMYVRERERGREGEKARKRDTEIKGGRDEGRKRGRRGD